jgi:hypothetical protein
MEKLHGWLVEYIVGGIERELHKAPANFVECHLVLCSHDESTCQINDGKHASCVMEGEHALKKKGPGHGMHQSDVIFQQWVGSRMQVTA